MATTPEFDAYEAAVASLRASLSAYASAVWERADFSDDTIDMVVELVTPKVVASQRQVAELTSVYFARATGTDPLPVDQDVLTGRGLPLAEVYRRPVVTARGALARGAPPEKALEAGGKRLQSLAGTDVQMAKVRQADKSLKHGGQQFYRRVPKGAATCALCLIASTQRYKVGNLAPIHPLCDCGVDVIRGDRVPHVIDPGTLEKTHERVASLVGKDDRGGRDLDYRKLIITHEHGEIGPLLSWRGDHFTSAADIPAL